MVDSVVCEFNLEGVRHTVVRHVHTENIPGLGQMFSLFVEQGGVRLLYCGDRFEHNYEAEEYFRELAEAKHFNIQDRLDVTRTYMNQR